MSWLVTILLLEYQSKQEITMKKLYMFIIPLCLILACPCPPRQTETESAKYMKVHFIDVGHGDCIFIETHDDGDDNNNKYQGYKILIDAGKKNRGTQYVIPYLYVVLAAHCRYLLERRWCSSAIR